MEVRRDQNRIDSFGLDAGKQLISSKAPRHDDEMTVLAQPREDLSLASRITEPNRQAERRRGNLGGIELHDSVVSV
jgi:hypothetical protein